MKSLLFPLITMMVLAMAACSKSNSKNPPGNGGTDSTGNGTGTGGNGTGASKANYAFANTEYNGLSTQVSEYYQKPIAIHFNTDSTVSAFSCFGWSLGGASLVLHDSIHGKITAVGSDGSGGTIISVTFDSTGDKQVMTISADKSGLTGGSISGSPAPGAVQFQFVGLKLFPSTPVSVGGTWSGDSVAVGSGFYSYYYPDVATFSFFVDTTKGASGTTGYLRNGLPYPDGIGVQPTYAKYWQYGSRVYFYGLNENYGYLIPYFGVLSADGRMMYVDTQDFSSARLPVPFQTTDAYGPANVTPNIHKEYVTNLP
jgi:hypothetical protein